MSSSLITAAVPHLEVRRSLRVEPLPRSVESSKSLVGHLLRAEHPMCLRQDLATCAPRNHPHIIQLRHRFPVEVLPNGSPPQPDSNGRRNHPPPAPHTIPSSNFPLPRNLIPTENRPSLACFAERERSPADAHPRAVPMTRASESQASPTAIKFTDCSSIPRLSQSVRPTPFQVRISEGKPSRPAQTQQEEDPRCQRRQITPVEFHHSITLLSSSSFSCMLSWDLARHSIQTMSCRRSLSIDKLIY